MIRTWLVVATAVATATPAAAQTARGIGAAEGAPSAADSAAIRIVALDYIEGYYAGDADRVRRALHPDLVKRIVGHIDGQAQLNEMTAEQLIDGTAAGWGTRVPATERRAQVRILDAFHNVAAVRVDAHTWIDYMQIARWNGEWKIVNVLWEMRQER